jgi:spore maturation protein CgeB
MAQFPTLIQKIRDELRIEPEPGFPKMGGTHYFALMQELHQDLKPDVYLEIGTESGASLALSKGLSIAIDPAFQIEADVMGSKSGLILQQCTSDAFFASGLLEKLGVKIDLAFLDGMHLFEYLLRDFINTEQHMSPDGAILMHDCVPFSQAGAKREWDRRETRSWTGDVWKLLPILQEYRPDLTVRTFDTPPSGLVVVSGLDPESRVLSDKMDEILARYSEMSFDDLGRDAFDKAAKITPYLRRVAKPRADQPLNFRIQTPVPRPRAQAHWGDHAFAVSLSEALQRAGHTAEIRTVAEWYADGPDDQIDIVLRGDRPYERRLGHLTLFWVLYFDDLGALRHDMIQADHVFAAGQPVVDDLSNIFGADAVSLMPQAVDATRMMPPAKDVVREGATFVGIAKRFRRPIVRQALRAKLPLQLWGRGWSDTPAAEFHKGDRVSPEDLGPVYARSQIVLNDHRPDMSRFGIPSNRIFDALACATPVITDPVAWLPEEVLPFVHQVSNARELIAATEAIAAEDATRQAARRDFAETVRQEHSFDARAARMIEMTEHLIGRETLRRTA